MQKLILLSILLILVGCTGFNNKALQPNTSAVAGDTVKAAASINNHNNAIYEVPVADGVSYTDVVDSLKSLSEGMNFVNPANFPIGEHMKLRGVDPQGVKEVHSFCNLSMGTEIILDHPEFLVFAPCRVALYEKPNEAKKMKLYIGLAKPTFDLKSIKNPTARAQKSAKELEDALIALVNKAAKGDI